MEITFTYIEWIKHIFVTHLYVCIYLNQALVCLHTHKDDIFVLLMGQKPFGFIIRPIFCFTFVTPIE